ncbi:MAG: hypothetical protein CR967_03295 [Proteobacteria bacterium]|nr:MAG: hypothetical protein CR967_03295 [Pseudomonadota bacterium]
MSQTGKLKLDVFESEGGKKAKSYTWIYKDEDGEEGRNVGDCSEGEVCEIKLFEGDYIAKTEYNSKFKKTKFSIKGGETTELKVIMGATGKLKLNVVETKGGKTVESHNDIYKFRDGEKGKSIYGCGTSKDYLCEKKLFVGNYVVESFYNDKHKSKKFSIKGGETTNLDIIMGETGKVQIDAMKNGKRIEVYNSIYEFKDGEKGRNIFGCGTSESEGCSQKLFVGDYIIDSSYDDKIKSTKVSIKGGETTKIKVDF